MDRREKAHAIPYQVTDVVQAYSTGRISITADR
jgi:hypothetical protein